MHQDKDIETDFQENIIHEQFNQVFKSFLGPWKFNLQRGYHSQILQFTFEHIEKEIENTVTTLIAYPSA
jgi:hypothetical protein